MRQRGSCRFAPYYKLQVWDTAALAWRDIQKQHPTPDAALATAPLGSTHRVMTVTESGRTPAKAGAA